MDLDTLKQRLKKYPDIVLDIQEEGLVSSITYQDVIFTNKRYGPLWDLFKRFHTDKIEDKDLKYIKIIEPAEVTTEVKETKVIDTDQIIEESELEPAIDVLKLHDEFRSRISQKVKLTAHLFKGHTRDVTGVIYTVAPDFIILFDSNGAERTIAFADLIKYKFFKKID